MKIQDSLTRELIRYILLVFGISDKNVYKNIGIIQESFKVSAEIKIQYEADNDDLIIKYPIYSASTLFNNSKLHVVGCIINNEFCEEYIALFKLDDLQLYGIKLDLTDSIPIFLISKTKEKWSKISLYDKIIACAGVEKLNDAGIIWKPEPLGDFYNYLTELAEM